MSRLAKKSIAIPTGVTIRPEGKYAFVKGPKGEIKLPLLQGVSLESAGAEVWIRRGDDERKHRMNQGTLWALVRNAIAGVTNGFTKVLEIEGVGYRAVVEGKKLILHLGYANPIPFPLPSGVDVKAEKNTLTISGIDKELVGRIAAEIRAMKKPEPYKGKGIHYQGEIIRRKAGKKAGAAATA